MSRPLGSRYITRIAVRVVIIAAALLVTPPAHASIVIGKGIGGVFLGMTTEQVRNVLSGPHATVRPRPYYGPQLEFLYPHYLIIFAGRRTVTSISTTSPAEKTTAGVGIGSTRATVKSKVTHVHCGDHSYGQCLVGDFLPGHVITQFDFSNGRVSQVSIAIVLE
jgi:hypothetical protein